MNLATLDQAFGITFLLMGLVSFISMTVIAARLKHYETSAVRNYYITQLAIAVFFILMLAPALGFAYKGLSFTAGCTMVMAGICAFGLTRLTNRARQILIQRYA